MNGRSKKQGIERLFVPYEIALDLKELGFDEPCLGGYIRFRGSGTFELAFYKYRNVDFNTTSNIYVSAPTYSQAFTWFREKYGLSGNTDCCDKLCEWNIKSSKLDKSIFSNKIQSYEKAKLECLKKLIEIVKQK